MLKCSRCPSSFEDTAVLWRCPCCGGHLTYKNPLPLFVSKDAIKQGPFSMWRYFQALPLPPEKAVTMGEGLTPLIPFDIEGLKVRLKLDGLCPTGSYKDRGIGFMVSVLKSLGVSDICEDSSGNAGASMAAYCAAASIKCRVFVPSHTSKGKISQIKAYGAKLTEVQGKRENAQEEAMRSLGDSFYGSHNWSPWFTEGIKTLAYELWEQMAWKVPDNLIVPVGQGSLVLGAYRGFKELFDLGLIPFMPRIHGVQAENCSPLALAFEKGLESPLPFDSKATLAEGIATSSPLRGKEVLEAVRKTSGTLTAVDENSIKKDLLKGASRGIFVEPTSAVVFGAFKNLVKKDLIKAQDETVLFLSASGLKALDEIRGWAL